MKTIAITIEEESDLLLKLKCDYASKAIGVQYDDGAQQLEFTRPADTADYEMVLMLNYGSGEFEENIGQENTFTLSNIYTQGDELTLQIAFYEGDTLRRGTSKIKFLFVPSPVGGSVPTGASSVWPEIKENAIVGASITTDGSLQLTNASGEATTIPVGTSTININGEAFAFKLDDDGTLYVLTGSDITTEATAASVTAVADEVMAVEAETADEVSEKAGEVTAEATEMAVTPEETTVEKSTQESEGE